MNSRILKWPLGACALLLSHLTLAIGLGEIATESAMDQRFMAEIELLNIGDLDENQMAVGLAPPEDFQNAGIDRDFQLADLKFRVDLANPNRPLIRVSSLRPIREPYLNFLVELRWPSGRLLREYTVLLDLPTFAGDAQVGKKVAATPTVAAESRRPAAPPPTSSPRPTQPSTSSADPSGRVQVRAGDTLWGIAARHRAPGATIPQTMVAIADANPQAFIQGNVNLIRRGAWLQMPDLQQVRAVDRATALSKLQDPPATPPVVESRAAAETPDVVTDVTSGELHLAAAGSGDTPGAAADGTGAEGEPQLAAVLEERDRLQRENAELEARIQSLESQLNTVSRLVELDDPALAALQQQADASPDEASSEAVQAPAADALEAAKETDVEAAGSPADTDPTPTPATAAPASTEQTPRNSPAESGPLAAMSRLSEWLIPALGLSAILLLGLVVLAALRKSSGVQQQGLELPSEVESGPYSSGLDPADGALAAVADEDLFAAPSTQGGPEDILSEADVCLSFGHDEQAEELLREALGEYPSEPRLHLKLLEVLATRDNRDAFESHLPQLAALGDLEAFAEAEALQRQRWTEAAEPDQPPAPVDTPAEEAPLEDFDLDLELDLDLETAQGPQPTAESYPTATRTDNGNGEVNLADFDLGLGEPEPNPPTDGVAEIGFEDLDLFEPGQEVATQLELAQAYVEMGDSEGAREILDYVVEAGDESQQEAARELLAKLN